MPSCLVKGVRGGICDTLESFKISRVINVNQKRLTVRPAAFSGHHTLKDSKLRCIVDGTGCKQPFHTTDLESCKA